ncbi:secretin receptor [Trichinella spiralis]|uniref:secretin receptor n=1 Tax=Trichinella spiralis TaxID=6334 RepID=UPI0001EFC43D|nr:secretin receptor [Trichinella spiralis]
MMCEVVADLSTTAGIKVPVKMQFFTKTNKARRSTAGDEYNEPLPRAGSFTSSTALLAHSSLNGDGRFIGNCERGPPTRRYRKLLRPTQQQPHTCTHTHYRTLPVQICLR